MSWALIFKYLLPYLQEILLGKDNNGKPTLVGKTVFVMFIAIFVYLFYTFYTFVSIDYDAVHDQRDSAIKELTSHKAEIKEKDRSIMVLAGEVEDLRKRVNTLEYDNAVCAATVKVLKQTAVIDQNHLMGPPPPPPPQNFEDRLPVSSGEDIKKDIELNKILSDLPIDKN